MRREYYLMTTVLLAMVFSITTDLFGDSRNLTNPYAEEYVVAVLDTIPLEDRTGDYITDPNTNPFDLKDPKIITQSVEFDPETGQYIITEKMGDEYFRPPTYMTFEEYLDYQSKQQQTNYFKELSGVSGGQRGLGGRIDPLADIDIKNSIVDRLFGGTEVDIRPQGSIDLTFGVDYSRTADPGRTARQQKTGGFDFDMDIQMDVEGSIGEKLKLNTNYNTNATFDFDNVMKLQYGTDDFGEDEIIKSIEAGNVSLPLRGTLITGSESLFGLKVETQWGRLRLTGIASQQKSEKEQIVIEDGGQVQKFQVNADEYDENRHFFLSHFNRETYELALSNLPTLNTNFNIERIQVFVKPRGNVFETYEIIALTDLGERDRITNTNTDLHPSSIAPTELQDCFGNSLPIDGEVDPLYQQVKEDRQADRAISRLSGGEFRLKQGVDFEKVTAVLLNSSQYSFHPQLGFVSLNVNIPPDQVVGVSFQYSYQNEVYQIGDFTDDVPSGDTINQNVIYTKMLKSTVPQVGQPMWDLMMKNIYSINGFQIAQEGFRLHIKYDDPGKGKKVFLPAETGFDRTPIKQIFGLDRLDSQGDPQIDGDGRFDFKEGVTILSRTGKIIFPKLEPFGSFIRDTIFSKTANAGLAEQFSFDTLYTGTVTDAREEAAQNRFSIEGEYKSAFSADISLGAFNIPPGSERVTAGGRLLEKDIDYEIDYTIGRIRILNEAILNSGSKITVNFEDSALFGFQSKTMLGLRADYEVNKNLIVGGTYMQLFERPYTQKVNIGDDPINNRMYGLDLTYSNEAPWLTKAVDKIPLINTKEASSISFTAEGAFLKPGHSKAINEKADTLNKDEKGGVIYIDDFEGTTSNIDMRNPIIGPNGWVLASTPQNDMFPESQLQNNTDYGVNRALLNWMRIEPRYQGGNNPYAMQIDEEEVFPNITPIQGRQNRIISMDIQYSPDERGPYNFDLPLDVNGQGGTPYSAGINQAGKLNDPSSRWGGIMRSLTTNDFQASNIEFVEFWVLNPYLSPAGGGATNGLAFNGEMDGAIYFELGNVSEDVLRDSRKFFENGLPGPKTQGLRTTSNDWGQVPTSQQITTAFDIDPANRTAQDVGFDGISDTDERIKHSDYLAALNTANINQTALNAITNDPSNDNYISFRDQQFDDNTDVFTRYARFFGSEGNSPTQDGNQIPSSSTTLPDTEDLDRDNTLNELESYFQYRVPIKFDGINGIDVESNPYIIDQISSNNGERTWYRFKIPLDVPDGTPGFKKVGGIENFRSVRFIRMYFKEFKAQMNFRFATLDLVRNQWRRYRSELTGVSGCPSLGVEDSETRFDVNSVSVEETSGYILPPGIIREQALGVNANARQNERSLSMTVCDMKDNYAKGIYKLVNMDMRQFKRMKMFVHGESAQCGGFEELEDGELTAFIRLGSDFSKNYYEYEIPISFTPQSEIGPENVSNGSYPRIIWPAANGLNIDFSTLVKMKRQRNKNGVNLNEIFVIDNNNSNANDIELDRLDERYAIIGNPNLGEVKSILIGIRNPCDDGESHSAEIWVNELRVFGLDERGGAAATARLDMQLADFGNVTLSGLASTVGFGQISEKVNERQRESIVQYDLATQLQLNKFLPEKWGLSVPFYFQYSKEISTPEYDPYDLDVKLNDKVKDQDTQEDKNRVKSQAKTVTTLKTYNFNNIRKERTQKDKPPMPWDISNFTGSYSFEETVISDPYIEHDEFQRERGALDYEFSTKAKPIKPFKGVKNKHLKFIKEINFNPLPKSFSFTTDIDRTFNTTRYRFAGDDVLQNTYYRKKIEWNRNYDLSWDIFKALKVRYDADFIGLIDEPTEKSLIRRNRLDPNDSNYISDIKRARRDSIYSNVGDLGRPKSFRQHVNVNFKVPLKNFPFLDWINATAIYDGGYHWEASSTDPFATSFGNVIENNQKRSLKLDFKFDKLYKKSKYLKKIDSKKRKKRSRGSANKKNNKERDKGKEEDKDKEGKDKKDKKKKDKEPSKIERALVRPLLLVRSLNVDFTQDFTTQVPGYHTDVDLLGLKNFNSPGWDFVFGIQPNLAVKDQATSRNWLYKNKDYILKNPKLYEKVTQTKNDRYKLKLKIEPVKDFKLDLNAERSYTERHSERFAYDTNAEDYIHAINNDFGTYEITYFAMQTLFKSDDELFGVFQQFQKNQLIIADRLAPNEIRPHENENFANQGFPYGYGPDNQNVSTPAFLAAYTGKNAEGVALSGDDYSQTLFDELPKVNWRLNYTGLSKLPMFKNIFQTIKISHGYQSKLRVTSFQTNLEFDFNEQVYNDKKFDYYSRFNIPNLVIDEAFSPLLGVDIRLKNSMSLRFESKKSRTLSARFDKDATQIEERKASDWSLGFGYTLEEVEFNFLQKKGKGKKKKKEEESKDKKGLLNKNKRGGNSQGKAGDLTLALDVSLRDDITEIYKVREDTRQEGRGTRVFSFNPSAEYRISQQLSLRLFFDYRKTTPKISEGSPQTNVAAGVTVRFQLQ